jgi:hypothetical protein
MEWGFWLLVEWKEENSSCDVVNSRFGKQGKGFVIVFVDYDQKREKERERERERLWNKIMRVAAT